MSRSCRNQQQKETEKKTFLADGSQISNDWKRKKTIFSLKAINSGKNGDQKKTFVTDVSQISNDWKRKKKLLSHI
mgnify:CR=1 FL=1